MTSKPPPLLAAISRESLVVIAFTVLGAVVRLWSLNRLGLVHFDEGIYAVAGLWSLSPQGLRAIDPTVIAYAPPGLPVLIGLSYLVFGVKDVAAILVSITAGTLTIPMAAWLARRTFGPGAGGVAAAFAALAGPHIAFSRMALTDASFLFFWLVAIGMGQRFLERPTPLRAVAMGLAVGLAQLFKYNGWITGAIVVASAAAWLVSHPAEWRTKTTAATWGWGVLAAVLAALVYSPWYRFVDIHGGYQALLAHQRSYLGDLSSWPAFWSLQLAEERFLSGNPGWLISAGLAAAIAMLVGTGDLASDRRHLGRLVVETAGLTALCSIRGSSWWLALVWVWLTLNKGRGAWTKSLAIVAIGWISLSILTPFYHPYARLWLPVEAFGWLIMAGVFVAIRSGIEIPDRGARWTLSPSSDRLPWFTLLCVFLAVIGGYLQSRQRSLPIVGPSDSLRLASRALISELPAQTKGIAVYGRPPLLFYLAQHRIPLYRLPDLAGVLGPKNPSEWAVLDRALIRQQPIAGPDLIHLLAAWTLAREIDTRLNGPTLLDIDPSAARSPAIDASAPLRLLRRKSSEKVR
jgi:dolichyl-phosphate-mannose-protein mannosyltransferase